MVAIITRSKSTLDHMKTAKEKRLNALDYISVSVNAIVT